MQKSYSPQPRRTNSKYNQQAFKLPMNNLALPLANSQLQSDQGQGSAKKIKQLLQVNPRTVINPAKVQVDIDKLQILMRTNVDRNLTTSNSLEQTLKEFRNKIDEQDSVIRLQEFKINRLQSELQFQKQQYQRMIGKFSQVEGKFNYYPTSTKLTKSSLSIVQAESVPSIAKLLQTDTKKRQKIIDQIRILGLENRKFKEEVKQKFQSILNLVNEFANSVMQVGEKYQSLYHALETTCKLHSRQPYTYGSQCQVEYQSMSNQYNILNKELQLMEQQKEVLYDKVISLL